MQRREFLMALAGAATLGAQNTDSRRRFLQSRTAEWDRGIPQWLRETRLPGASLVLIDGGQILWQREFGVRDAVSKRPVERNTVFAACSDTKPVFAYAVVKLCEKGVMDLDTPLTRIPRSGSWRAIRGSISSPRVMCSTTRRGFRTGDTKTP